MRIDINTLFLIPDDVGGTEVYLRNTLVAMAALDLEHTLVLFTNSENDRLFRDDLAGYSRVEFHQLPCRAATRPLRILAGQFLLPFAAKSRHVDVLWSPGYTAPAIYFSPQVVTICDLQYMSFPEDMTVIERKTLDVLVRTACKRCQAVITISEFSRQEVIKYNFTDAEQVFAVLLGVTDEFSYSSPDSGGPEDFVQVLSGLGVQKPFILCVAHTYPHKNVDKLIDAFGLLQDAMPHHLVLVGKARRGEKAVQESINKVPDSGRIVRLRSLTDNNLRVLFQQADIFVLPSSYEGFGLPVIEAMMAGVPVVTPKMASLPEVGGKYSFYVDAPKATLLAEQILHVLDLSETERINRIHKAREWAQTFTWERTATQTLSVLQSIAEDK